MDFNNFTLEELEGFAARYNAAFVIAAGRITEVIPAEGKEYDK